MKSYLCANRHHFHAPRPRCPYPGCTAEVRPTAVHPSTDGDVPAFKHLPRLDGEAAPAPSPALETAPATRHAVRWWAYTEDGERTRRTSAMKDKDHVWDATCSCGWDSGTGGAPMGDVDRLAKEHKG